MRPAESHRNKGERFPIPPGKRASLVVTGDSNAAPLQRGTAL